MVHSIQADGFFDIAPDSKMPMLGHLQSETLAFGYFFAGLMANSSGIIALERSATVVIKIFMSLCLGPQFQGWHDL